MARNKSNQTNIDNSDPTNYPDARIKNNTGANNGTPVNEAVYGDIHEFFAKLMRLAAIPYNDQPDNETLGYQYIDALTGFMTKNNQLRTLSVVNSTILAIDTKVGTLKTNEMFICRASASRTAQNNIRGTDNVSKSIQVAPSPNISSGDFVLLIYNGLSFNTYVIPAGSTILTVLAALSIFPAASNAEELAGIVSNKFCTPLNSKSAFTARVNGAQSGTYLATELQNGLLSATDKAKINNMGVINYGTIFNIDIGNTGAPFSDGDLIDPVKITETANYIKVRVTFVNPMGAQYYIRTSVQSLGGSEVANASIGNITWEPISSTQAYIMVREFATGVQGLKIHVEALNS